MISKVISSNSSSNLLKYILDDSAHNNELTTKRNLAIKYKNVHPTFSGFDKLYTASQFTAVQKLAQNKDKKVKAYHLIFSFSDAEFPLPKDEKELEKQSKQAVNLVNKFLNKQLPKDAQFVASAQRDNDGKKMHVHVALNAVRTSGKVIDTRQLTWSDREKIIPNKNKNEKPKKEKIKGLKSRIDDFMLDNFEAVTGREYKPIEPVLDNLVKSNEMQVLKHKNTQNKPLNSYLWKEDLKEKIYKAFSKSDSLNTFENELNKLNITVKKRKSSYTKADGTKAKREAYTYYFTDKTGKQRRIKDFSYRRGQPSGLGKSFTPESIEREYENAKTITREQFQNDVNKSIEEYSERNRQLDGINSESIQGRTRENGTGTTRENSRTSEERSTERVFENVDTEGLERAKQEFSNGDKSTNAINKFIEYNQDGQKRKQNHIQLFKLDLQTVAEIERKLLEKQQNQRNKRKFKSDELGIRARRINKYHAKHFNEDRSRSSKASTQRSKRDLPETNRSNEQKTVDEPNPFDDMF